jgi:hypothetical protein
MDSKSLRNVTIKNAAKGEVSAVFSTFNVVDLDGDVTVPGAFKEGQEVVISAYGHTSWQGALPVGKGIIRTTDSEAILEGNFFMDTTAGRDTFAVVKELGPRQQWSYGFDVLDSESGEFGGKSVRFLKSMDTHEVSPTLVGAGINTRTLGVKSRKEGPVTVYKGAIRPHDTDVSLKAWTGVAQDDIAPVADLRAAHAWVDITADPEAKSSYRFAHHGPDGAASLRACLLGIAALKTSPGIPETDIEGVYEHLASHLRDADYEPPSLKSTALQDELVAALAGVAAAIESAERVVALRAEKGKTLSQVNSELLVWMNEDMRRLKSLIDTPQEDLAREFVRFLSIQHGKA